MEQVEAVETATTPAASGSEGVVPGEESDISEALLLDKESSEAP